MTVDVAQVLYHCPLLSLIYFHRLIIIIHKETANNLFNVV